MPEIDRAKLSAKLDTIPEADREPYLAALKSSGYTWKVEGPMNDVPNQPSDKAQDLGEALLTTKPTDGIGQDLVRALPATGGAMAGAASGAAMGAPLGPIGMGAGAIAGAALGGGAGEALRQGVSSLTAAAFPDEKFPINKPRQVLKDVGGKSAEAAMGEGGGMLAGPAMKAAAPIAKKAVGFMAKTFGGLADESVKMLERNAPAVVKYARMGVDQASEAASTAAKSLQTHIDEYASKAGEAYREAIEKIVAQNPKYNQIRIDLARNAGDAIQAIRNEFGFAARGKMAKGHMGTYEVPGTRRLPNLEILDPSGNPIQAAQGAINRVGKSEADTQLFNEFVDQFRRDATPTQAYYLQLDLSQAIRANEGKPVAAALAKLKKAAIESFDRTVEGTPLSSANKGYRAAMELMEELGGVANADNAVTKINSAFRNKTATRDALNVLARSDPKAQQALEEVFAATAGKQVAHWAVQLPPTGAKAAYQVGLGGSVATAIANPVVGIPIGAAYLGGTSPRLYGEAFKLLSKQAPKVPRGSATAAVAALRARRQENERK